MRSCLYAEILYWAVSCVLAGASKALRFWHQDRFVRRTPGPGLAKLQVCCSYIPYRWVRHSVPLSAGDAEARRHRSERGRSRLDTRNRCPRRPAPETLDHCRGRGIRSCDQSDYRPILFIADPAYQTKLCRLVARPHAETDALYLAGYPNQNSFIIIGHSRFPSGNNYQIEIRDVGCKGYPSAQKNVAASVAMLEDGKEWLCADAKLVLGSRPKPGCGRIAEWNSTFYTFV
jgi:hypothetical protein